MFQDFSRAVTAAYNKLAEGELFVVGLMNQHGQLDNRSLEKVYIRAFPEGSDPLYKTETEHTCNCCFNFLRNLGHVVSIKDGKITTIWQDLGNLPAPYATVAAAMDTYIRSLPVAALFRRTESVYGAEVTHQKTEDGVISWNHFYGEVHKQHRANDLKLVGEWGTNVEVLRRGMTEISDETITTAADLLQDGALYRGAEYAERFAQYVHQRSVYRNTCEADQHNWLWEHAGERNSTFINTAFGKLLKDIEKGDDLQESVDLFGKMMDPNNFKRPKPVLTEKMVADAMATIRDNGLEGALQRRTARITDISVNNVLWVAGDAKKQMKGGLEGLLMTAVAPKADKVNDDALIAITMDDFMKSVVPSAMSMEAFVSNAHKPRFMTLTTSDDKAKLFKWNNQFAWSYNGGLADSDMRRKVVERGGSVNGVFRFTHMWNYGQRNASLMDLHVFFPGNLTKVNAETKCHDNYGTRERVGWNNRKHARSGGVQDVDYTMAAPEGYVPVENITFQNVGQMPEGTYTCRIHNWKLRAPTHGGFKAEIEVGGVVYEYEYDKPLADKEWVTVAEVTLKNGTFTVDSKLPCNASSQDFWGVTTEKFVPVQTLLLSPNFWDGQAVGNKHWFFILEGCRNPEEVRGLYNEFLSPAADEHRKVFEVLGGKTKCQSAEDQLSGLGFSSTQRDIVIVRVTTATTRKTYRINF